MNENAQNINNVIFGNNVFLSCFINLYGCSIGDDCKIGSFVEIQKDVRIGNRCKISSHSFLCSGVKIGDGVFIGHNVSFVNDKYPRAVNSDGALQTSQDWEQINTWVEDGASIGTGATIMCGVHIGKGALVGAGSVVTKDVPENAVVAGNPAKILRYKDEN